MRSTLNAEQSLIEFNAQKDLLHKQTLRKLNRNFVGKERRLRERNVLDKVLHRWTNEKPQNKYFTCGRDIKSFRDVLKEESPYTLPATSWYVHKHEEKKIDDGGKIKNYQKMTQRGRDSEDILSRVYVPADTRPLPLGVCDFTPDYFSIVKGREKCIKPSIRDYLSSIRTTLKHNILTAIFKDRTELINQQFIYNFEKISSLYSLIHDMEETLKSFSYYDEHKTLQVKNTRKMFYKVYSKNLESLESIMSKTSSILNDVQFTWDRLMTRIHCKKILYEISPPSWQKWYDQKARRWNPEDMQCYVVLNKQYEDYLARVKVPHPDIAKIVSECKAVCKSLGPNLVYYSHMSQAEQVFKNLESQASLALEYFSIISTQNDKLRKLLDETEKYYIRENKMLENMIEMLEKKIEDNNNRATALENRLNTKSDSWFKDTIVGEETMMIKSLIQCLFDEIVGKSNRVLSNREMMEQLEAKMINLSTDIEQIGKSERKGLSEKLKQTEAVALAKAEEAKLKETGLKNLLKQMEASMKDRPPKTLRDLRPRSPPINTVAVRKTFHHKSEVKRNVLTSGIDNDMIDDWDCLTYNSISYVPKKSSEELLELIDS